MALARGGELACGAAGGDRTHDPWLRRPILYPLSYSRNKERGELSHALCGSLRALPRGLRLYAHGLCRRSVACC